MPQQKQMHLFDLLKQDHRQVEQIFGKLEKASNPEKREDLFAQLQNDFLLHCQIEEKFLYPQLKKINEMKSMADDALKEHKESKELLTQLEDLLDEEDQWESTLQEFWEGVQHHLDDEENKVFPRCSDFINDQQLREIAMKCMEEKEREMGTSSGGSKSGSSSKSGGSKSGSSGKKSH